MEALEPEWHRTTGHRVSHAHARGGSRRQPSPEPKWLGPKWLRRADADGDDDGDGNDMNLNINIY